MPYLLTKLGSHASGKNILANDKASLKAHEVIVWVEKVYKDVTISYTKVNWCYKVATQVVQILKSVGNNIDKSKSLCSKLENLDFMLISL